MFSYPRLKELFLQLCHHTYTSMQELEDFFHVTDRTIRADISNLNQELSAYNIEIKRKRGYGYYFKIQDETLFQEVKEIAYDSRENFDLNSMENRIDSIILQLLYHDDYIQLDDLADSVYVSRATIQTYLKQIKTRLESFNLMCLTKNNRGIRVFGNEQEKRECLLETIHHQDTEQSIVEFSSMEQYLFQDIDLVTLQNIITKNLEKENIEVNDYEFKNLLLHFALMCSRVQHENYLPYDKEITIPSTIASIIDTICHDCQEAFHLEITKGEKQYIYLHLVSNSKLHIGQVNPTTLQNNITQLLDLVYEEYNFDLRNDEILKKDLFNHFSSIFSAKDIRIQKKNPLLHTIKSNFPLPYEITLTTTAKVFMNPLTVDEVGYVSLHLGAAIERCFSGQYKQKKVLLVCGSGVATTRMLEARLDAFFHNKIIIVERVSYQAYKELSKQDFADIDFVISTVPISSTLVPVEVVNFTLNNKDVENISRRISAIGKHESNITRFFDSELFKYYNQPTTKDVVLKDLSHLLEQQGIVDQSYLVSVLQREKLAQTNMNSVFAIPHPMTPSAEKTKVAVAILNPPVQWNEDGSTVQIIFMLCMKAKDQKDIEHLYDLFIDIVNDDALQQKILQTTSYSSFYSVISNLPIKK